MSQDESKKPEPFLPDEVKDFDSLVEWLRWRGEPPKRQFQPWWPWRLDRFILLDRRLREPADKENVAITFSLATVAAFLLNDQLQKVGFRESGLTFSILLWTYLNLWLLRLHQRSSRDVSQHRDRISAKNRDALIITHITDSIHKSKDELIEPLTVQAGVREEELARFEHAHSDHVVIDSKNFRTFDRRIEDQDSYHKAREVLVKAKEQIEQRIAMIRQVHGWCEGRQVPIAKMVDQLEAMESAAKLEPSIATHVEAKKEEIFTALREIGDQLAEAKKIVTEKPATIRIVADTHIEPEAVEVTDDPAEQQRRHIH